MRGGGGGDIISLETVIRQNFDIFDIDKDGLITRDEFKVLMTKLGVPKIFNTDVGFIVAAQDDANKDNLKINFNAFNKYLISKLGPAEKEKISIMGISSPAKTATPSVIKTSSVIKTPLEAEVIARGSTLSLDELGKIWETLSPEDKVKLYKNLTTPMQQLINGADKITIDRTIAAEKHAIEHQQRVAQTDLNQKLNIEWETMTPLQRTIKLTKLEWRDTQAFLSAINEANIDSVITCYAEMNNELLYSKWDFFDAYYKNLIYNKLDGIYPEVGFGSTKKKLFIDYINESSVRRRGEGAGRYNN
jgi:hypothetical protein